MVPEINDHSTTNCGQSQNLGKKIADFFSSGSLQKTCSLGPESWCIMQECNHAA
jgi:hypothetical protein